LNEHHRTHRRNSPPGNGDRNAGDYIGYLNSEIGTEQDQSEPNMGRVAALEHPLEMVLGERRLLTPDNLSLINRALYVYAPLLKPMRR
jgi:hypothetical protein